MNYSLAELLSFARGTAGGGESSDVTEAQHYTISELTNLALQALNGSEAGNRPGHRMPTPTGSGRYTAMHEPESGLIPELQQELRLIEQETGVAPNPAAPVAGYVRAVASMGNPRAQRLLARLKAALSVLV